MDFKNMLNSIFTLPKTQKDVAQIAELARQTQSPQLAQQIAQAQSDLTAAVGTQLALQAVAAAALIGIFILLYKKS